MGSGCGTANSAVASDPKDTSFEFSHRQLLGNEQLLAVCRNDIIIKRGMTQLKNQLLLNQD